ncbi:MFS transporter [Clostridium sp. 19966]|uniref:MFS transporter n=1 Tax=Clostridium sp. 19966 TaxID=2768166 RepID=UPI0028DDC9A8|nr:MFS transporter [Clostridium sp. 19966]MDT8716332.1 MFS transporter [Clostridium sp. 19966]
MFKSFNKYLGLTKEIYTLAISKTINSMGNFVLPLLTLILTEKVGLSKTEAGIYLLILSVSYVPGLIIGGKMVDIVGRKKIIIIFHTLAACVYLGCGVIKPSIIMVYLLILGASLLAASMPAYDALAADMTDNSNRKKTYSLLFMGHNFGFAIAPVLGGFLFKNHLSLVFIIDATSTFLSVALITIFVKEPKTFKNSTQLHKDANYKDKSLIFFLKNTPIVAVFSALLFCYQFAYSQWGYTMPLQLTELFKDKGAYYYGIIAGFNGILILIFTPLVTKLTYKLNILKVISLGGILYSIAFGVLIEAKSLHTFFITVLIMTFGEMMVTINNSTFITTVTPPSHRGRVNGYMQIMLGAGFSLGPFMMGIALIYISIRSVWLIISIEVLIAAILMLFLGSIWERNGIDNRY